jgi:putative transcription factor
VAPRVAEGLARRERRMGGGRDVFATEQMDLELVEDFNQRIRTARERKDWTRQQLGARIKEPENAVAQFEAGTLHPTDQVAKRIERALGITLFEKVAPTAGASKASAGRGLTLGDMIKDERTKKDD